MCITKTNSSEKPGGVGEQADNLGKDSWRTGGPMVRILPHGIDTTNPRRMHLRGFRVVPPRIELGTQGFSVLCSTN